MKIKALLSFTYSAIIVSVLVLVGVILLIVQNQSRLNEAQEVQYESYLRADELRQTSDDLTRMARTYVLTGDDKYEKIYWDILAIRSGEKPRPENYEKIYWDLVTEYGQKPRPDSDQTIALLDMMKDLKFTQVELDLLEEANKQSNDLVTTETIAMNAMKGLYDDGLGNYTVKGDVNQELAMRIMFDSKYHSDKAGISKPISDFFELLDKRTSNTVSNFKNKGNFLLTTSIIIVVFITFLTLFIAILIVGRITKPLKKAKAVLEKLSSGYLKGNINSQRKDEFGDMLSAIDVLINKLREIVADVQSSASSLSAGSEELSSSANQLSSGATEQAASAEEVSSSMEEMASNIQQNTDNANQTENIARKVASDANDSGLAVNNAVEAMKQIAGKINIIEEIARQTNLLALNAAIEAARAGEHGKGFAVVASEVRKLAERRQTAAGEISELSSTTVFVAEKAGAMLEALVPDIQKTAELVQEISSASKEQNFGVEQINKALLQLDKVTQINASSSEEMASTSEELSAQSMELNGSMSFFKIDGDGFHSDRGEKVQMIKAPQHTKRKLAGTGVVSGSNIRDSREEDFAEF